VALQLAIKGKHGKVVGVLIGAGMAAGQDVNTCLGSVICVCMGVYGCVGVVTGVCR
jgi:hypothetical protein